MQSLALLCLLFFFRFTHPVDKNFNDQAVGSTASNCDNYWTEIQYRGFNFIKCKLFFDQISLPQFFLFVMLKMNLNIQ